jgi:hypothetical protein
MPQVDKLRREVFDVRLNASLDVGKASKSEDIDIALVIHFASSGNAQLTIIDQEGFLIVIRPMVETCLSLLLLSQCSNLWSILYDGSQRDLTTVNITGRSRDSLLKLVLRFHRTPRERNAGAKQRSCWRLGRSPTRN